MKYAVEIHNYWFSYSKVNRRVRQRGDRISLLSFFSK
jgi:hypothetical protein